MTRRKRRSVKVIRGDCLDVLAGLKPNSLDACVCDPPYHLQSIVKRFGGAKAASEKYVNAAPKSGYVAGYMPRGFMGKTWDGGDIAFQIETWREVFRVLKPGAHLVAFGGTRTYHRMACAIEDAGFEIRDCVQWLYGSGFPKSHDVSKAIDRAAGAEREVVEFRDPAEDYGFARNRAPDQSGSHIWSGNIRSNKAATDDAQQWEGWGTALKPACEPIVLARKPLSESTIAANVMKWGTGALNIDGCRIEANGEKTGSNGAVGLTPEKGWNANSLPRAVCREQSTTTGRWPANVIHDGSDEVVEAFPESVSNAGRRGLSGRHDPGQGAEHNRIKDYSNSVRGHNDSGSAARFFYCAKASRAERNGSKHPTVKPQKLLRYLCRLVTPPGGTVLDCFAGTGTTGQAARLEGFSAILIERERAYVRDIKRRLAA